MNEDHHNTAILWEIKGVLTEFKENTTRQFSEIKDLVSEANSNAVSANDKAEAALSYSKGIVFRSGLVGSMTSFFLLGVVWILEHGIKVFSIIR